MTKEVRYIIENRTFPPSLGDYLAYWQFAIPVVLFFVGIRFIWNGISLWNYLLGALFILIAPISAYFIYRRIKQINAFDEIENNRSQDDNFQYVSRALKNLNVVDVDRDIHNWTISARHKSTFLPPPYEWLTIVCLDEKILVNSRPLPPTAFLWLRRNAMIEFRKVMKQTTPYQ